MMADWDIVKEEPAPWAVGSETSVNDLLGRRLVSPPKNPTEMVPPSELFRIMSTANEKVAETAGIPGDLLHAGAKKAGLPVGDNPLLGSEMLKGGLRSIGASRKDAVPETLPGRMASGALGEGVSAIGTGGGIGSILRSVGRSGGALEKAGTSIADPVSNWLSGVGSGGLGELGEAAGGGVGKIGGELAGGALTGMPGLLKPIRGPRAVTNQHVLDAYETLGLSPSAAEKDLGGRSVQWMQGNVLPQLIGSSNVMEKFRQRKMGEVTKIQDNIATQFGAPRKREDAGSDIQKAIMETWENQKAHDGHLMNGIKDTYGPAPMFATNLLNAVVNPVGVKHVSPDVRATVIDPEVKTMSELIRGNGGVFSIADLIALKTSLNKKLEPGPVKNVNDAQISQLRDAINKDIVAGIKSINPTDAVMLQQANARYGAAMENFKQNFANMIGKEVKVSEERAFEILMSAGSEKNRGDMSKFKAVWEAMPPQARGDLAATVLSRMGYPDKSAIGDPEKFSLSKFLTSYRDMSSDAKNLLFRTSGNVKTEKELDALLTVAENINEKLAKLGSTSRSGTAALGMQGIHAVGSMFSGDMSGLLTNIGGPVLMSYLFTNPSGVRVLTGTLKKVEQAMDGSLRSMLDLHALPQMGAPPEKGKM